MMWVLVWLGPPFIVVAHGDGTGIHRLPTKLGTSQIEVFGWRPTPG